MNDNSESKLQTQEFGQNLIFYFSSTDISIKKINYTRQQTLTSIHFDVIRYPAPAIFTWPQGMEQEVEELGDDVTRSSVNVTVYDVTSLDVTVENGIEFSTTLFTLQINLHSKY